MYDTEELIISVFCCVDDFLRQLTQGQRIRARGFAPSLSDSEVLTMEIVGEFRGLDCDRYIWKYFHDHWLKLFPSMTSRSTFVRQAANLWSYKQQLQQRLAEDLGAFQDSIHLIDGIPIPLCCFSRAKGCRLFAAESDYGYCAAKKETYYGFHGHLVVSAVGVITGFTLTPANGSEQDAVWELVGGIRGLLIGDKGYINSQLQMELSQSAINLQTPKRSNMKETRSKSLIRLLNRFRRLIETVIGQLCERFNFEKVRARDMWHLTSRLNRKLLAHTVCIWLNRHSPNPLQFEQLLDQ